MEYALERLDQLIRVVLEPLKNNSTNDKAIFPGLLEKGKNEINNIRLYLQRKACSGIPENLLETFIQQYQASLIELLDTVYHYQREDVQKEYKEMLAILQQMLQGLLHHIEHRYQHYFDVRGKVPEPYLQMCKKEIGKEKASFERVLKIQGADEKLVSIVTNDIKRFLQNKGKTSYQQMIYVKDLVQEIHTTHELLRGKVLPVAFEYLVYMNFNSALAANYLMDHITNELNKRTDLQEKLQYVNGLSKEIAVMPVKANAALRYKEIPLKEIAMAWIQEEIKYMSKPQMPLLHSAPQFEEWSNESKLEKIHFSTSSEVLALLIRAGMDTQLILNKEKSPVLRMVTKSSRTIEQENLSYNSLRNNWYVADKRNKEKVKGILMDMYKVVHKY